MSQILSERRLPALFGGNSNSANCASASAAAAFIPWLQTTAPALKKYVEDVLNAPQSLRTMWQDIRDHANLPKKQIAAFEQQLAHAKILLEYVSGEVVSTIVTAHLLAEFPDLALKPNGKSDYPDVYLSMNDYSNLPKHSRKATEYGASLKGRPPRPVRVPDGLEIKTCRETLRVDCHHPHVGLHLALVFKEEVQFTVEELAVAFLRRGNYHEAGRQTTATTVKFSFNGDTFLSLL